MPYFLLKTTLSSGLAVISLLFASDLLLAQSPDLNRARQLADIAFGYGLANAPDKAILLLEQATTYTGGDCFEANAWLKISAGYEVIQQLDKAEPFLARAVETARDRTEENCASSATSPEESLLNRATDYAQAGHLELALKIANSIDSFFQPITLAKIAGEYYEAGQQQQAEQIVTEAVAIAQESDTLPMGNQNLLAIAMAEQLTQAEQIELASLVIEKGELTKPQVLEMPDDLEAGLYNFQALRLVRLLVKLEQPQEALTLLNTFVPNIQPSSEFPMDGIENWIEAALLYNTLGSNQADEIWEKVRVSLQQITDAQLLASAQRSLVRGYAELGDFEQASALAKSIEETNARQAAHSAIVTAYAREGLVEEANRLVQSMGNPEVVQLNMVRAYLETEQYNQAEALAQQLTQQPALPNALAEVGRTYCDVGLPERVVPLIDRSPSANGLRGCAATEFAKQGQFVQALELAETITESEHRSSVLVAIAAQCPQSSPRAGWHRLIGWLPKSLKTWLGVCDSQKAVDLLDKALNLI